MARWAPRPSAVVRTIDDSLVRSLGLPYLRLSRRSAHERFRYALAAMDALGLVRPTVLDLGCNSGMLARYLATYPRGIASYTGIDLRASRLASRYRELPIPTRFVDVDLDSDWRFPGNDLAWCSEVLEHLLNDGGVLERIAAAVKPGGYVIVTMPSLAFLERASRTMPYLMIVSATQDGGHVRVGYTAESLRKLAAHAGLEVVRIDAVSPRTPAELRVRNFFHGAPVIYHTINNLPLAFAPAHVFGAGPEALRRYISIAAVLRRPSG